MLVGVAVVACGCGGDGGGDGGADGSRPATDLEISFWPSGMNGASRNRTLQCRPPGGTLPNADAACTRLEELGDEAFRPVPKEIACAQIFGGPQVAEVRGTFEGRPVAAVFNRTNGCEMERWTRHEFLFPTA